jgi:probable O-glycosylation ligase (exosortase A-associated)
MRDLIIIGFVLGSAPVCLVNPYYGVMVWTWIAYFNPHRYAWGLAYNFPVAQVIALPTLVGTVFAIARGRVNKHVITRETILMLFLWIWFLISFLNAMNSPALLHHIEESQRQFQNLSKILLMTFLMVLVIDSKPRLRYLFILTALSFSALAIKGLLFGLRTAGEARVWGPPDSFIADNNSMALAMNMSLPIFFFMAKVVENKNLRRVLRIAFISGIFCVILSYSRGGLLGLSAVLGAIAMKSNKKIISIFLIVVCVFMILTFAPAKWMDRMTKFAHGELDNSAEGRLHAWYFAFQLAKDKPLTGGSFNTFTPELYQKYAPDPDPMMYQGPHSIYFQVLGELGFAGAAIWAALVLSCIFSLRSLRKKLRRYSDPWMVASTHMFEVAIYAFMVSGAFLGVAYFDYFFQLVAGTVVLKILFRRDVKEAASAKLREEQSVQEVQPSLDQVPAWG